MVVSRRTGFRGDVDGSLVGGTDGEGGVKNGTETETD